ncbi:MAG: zf-HC2 domain-containing protein, partial [Lachnospiraceae bacterium]|nr:zf-HC2 domain-containing protein [Lachnospiraceae bacterium]
MINQKIPCEMIQDILPLYVDELTSEVTNKEVEAHLAECEVCRESQKRLGTELKQVQEKKLENGRAEIDYLKKIRRVNKKVTIAGILA